MKFTWLEKMAESGDVRPEVKEMIYAKCGEALEKGAEGGWFSTFAQSDFAHNAGMAIVKSIPIVASTVVGVGASVAIPKIFNSLSNSRVDSKTVAAAQVNKSRLLSEVDVKSYDKQKIAARFDEVMKYAPTLCANYLVVSKLVLDKAMTGFTSQDIQNLVNIQTKLTPEISRYSNLSEVKLSSEAAFSTQEKTACALGESFAAVYAETVKTAAGVPGGFRQLLGHALATSAGSLVLAGGLGAVAYANKRIGQKDLENKLRTSFDRAMMMAKNNEQSQVPANPEKARDAFESLVHFAPHVAADPHAALGFMTKMVSGQMGIQATDVKDLSEIERNLRQARPSSSFDMLKDTLSTAGVGGSVDKAWRDAVAPQGDRYRNDRSEFVRSQTR